MPEIAEEVCRTCVHSQVQVKCQFRWGEAGQDFGHSLSDGRGGCLVKNATKKVATPKEADTIISWISWPIEAVH